MASPTELMLQLLLISAASASHHYGGTQSFTYKGRNLDGSFRVQTRARSTFDGCRYSHSWHCYGTNCGISSMSQRGVIDSSSNTQRYNRQWCESETISMIHVSSDNPFQRRAYSCCWVHNSNGIGSWSLMTHIDLGTRSDTRQPNRSPDVAIVPFLRVPQNCPRAYNIMAFDPDGDHVRCRYGNIRYWECTQCNLPSGFYLDQESCTLHYNNTSARTSVFGFEMVVEDFPQSHITMAYADGSRSSRAPLSVTMRKKRSALITTVDPFETQASAWSGSTQPATINPNTAVPATKFPDPSTNVYTTPFITSSITTAPQTITTAATTATTTTTTPPTTTIAATTATTTTNTPPPTKTTTTTITPPTTTIAATTATTTTTPPPPTKTTTTTITPPTTTTAAATTTTTTTTLPTTTSTPVLPLSKIPLQFSLLVDQPAPSCQVGDYLPKFIDPTPANRQQIQAEVNREVEIKIKAQALNAKIQNVVISGPMNMTKLRNTHEEFGIRWTPRPDDLGHYFPICFVVEATSGTQIYQSEMRCVLVHVKAKQVKSHVICNQSSMTVMVDKVSLRGLNYDHLQLTDPTNMVCSLQTHSNSSHVIAVIPLNACGTQIEENDDYLFFKNEITTVDNPQDLITRKHLLEVQFYCQYPKRGNVTLSFTAHRRTVTVWDKGFGKFTYQFEFYPNNQFRTMIDPNSYPLDYDLGSRIFMQIEAVSNTNNTKLFVESCRAAPYDNPNYRPTYSIIENGCRVDQTVQIHASSDEKQFRFSMEAFKFIGLHNQVYISCSVMMCEAGNPNTRCSRGCLPSTQTDHLRRRREAGIESAIETASHSVSQGPLRLRKVSGNNESSVTWNLNLNVVFIAGCLLAAVGMVCGVVLHKAQKSKFKYQTLPSFEH